MAANLGMRAGRETGRMPGALRLAALLGGLMMLSACSAIYRDHGYVPPAEDLEAIVLGVDTRDSVIEAVGAPATSSLLDTGDLYYVSSRVQTIAMRRPKVIEREVVAVNFDAKGIARNIERFRLEDGRAVPLNRRVTDSSLRDKTFLRQLLGNLGRIDPTGAFSE